MNHLSQIGSGLPGGVGADFQVTLGSIISTFVRYALLLGGFFVAYQLFYGALQWVLSGGDKEKLTKARQQMTNSMIGLVILFSVWTIFLLITGDILGIFRRSADGGIRFELPYLFQTTEAPTSTPSGPTSTPPIPTPTLPVPTPTPSAPINLVRTCLGSNQVRFTWDRVNGVGSYILRIDKKDNLIPEWDPEHRPTDRWICSLDPTYPAFIEPGAVYNGWSIQSSALGCPEEARYGMNTSLLDPPGPANEFTCP